MTNNKQKMPGFKTGRGRGKRREREIPTSCAVLVKLGSHVGRHRGVLGTT